MGDPGSVRAACFLPAGKGGREGQEYTGHMTVLDARRHHDDLVEELIAEVGAYNPDVDRDLLRRAFEVAERAHAGQTRRSGEEFILHPLGVARICAELHLDEQTIAAALLHDVVEDTGADLDEIRAEFGAEIAQLVEGVTKLSRISFQSREQAEAAVPDRGLADLGAHVPDERHRGTSAKLSTNALKSGRPASKSGAGAT